MDITLHPRKLAGDLTVIPSKSQAHRLLICAALADGPTQLVCPQVSRDMEATAQCLQALGAKIHRSPWGYTVVPIDQPTQMALLPCRDSGSTLRFLLPVVGALGCGGTFQLEGRLPMRPLSPLWEEMVRMGCTLTRPTGDTICCQGRLRPGRYSLDGGISSQFITGMLLAACQIPGETEIVITGKVESKPYIAMTLQALEQFGLDAKSFRFDKSKPLHSPGRVTVEGDWSNGAFFLAAQALGSPIEVLGLSQSSCQGDRAVAGLLPQLHENITISARDIPDLIPILAVVAACRQGAAFSDIQRLRLKESDRVASVVEMIRSLGGRAEATEDTLQVWGTGLTGGTVHSHNDHRIAMAAAIAATCCQEPVTILTAESVEKSYPQFWEEYRRLGGYYEQYLR